jgi:hypothetical protein
MVNGKIFQMMFQMMTFKCIQNSYIKNYIHLYKIKLVIRLNHFFRSFWAVESINKLSLLDMKYMDMAIATRKKLQRLLKANPSERYNTTQDNESYDNKVDASYWDTYDMVDKPLLGLMPVIFLNKYGISSRIYGTNNNRVDNIDGFIFLRHVLSYNVNKYSQTKWKTAHMEEISIKNEHLNMYKSCKKHEILPRMWVSL